MEITVFQQIYEAIYQMQEGLGNSIQAVADIVMPVIGSLFLAYVMMTMINYWNGSSGEQTMMDLTKKFFAWALIIGLGVNISSYNEHIKPLILNTGNELAQSVNNNIGQGGGNGLYNNGVGDYTTHNGLDKILGELLKTTNIILEKSIVGENLERDERGNRIDTAINTVTNNQPTPTPDLNNPQIQPTEETNSRNVFQKIGDKFMEMKEAVTEAVPAVMGQLADKFMAGVIGLLACIVLWVCGLFFLAIVASDLFVAQIILSLLSVVAPVFISFALFSQTRGYFQSWVNAVLANSFLILFVSIVANMALTLLSQQIVLFNQKISGAFGVAMDEAVAGVGNVVAGNVGQGAGQGAVALGAVAQGMGGSIFSAVIVLGSMFVVFGLVSLQLPSLAGNLFSGFSQGGGNTVWGKITSRMQQDKRDKKEAKREKARQQQNGGGGGGGQMEQAQP